MDGIRPTRGPKITNEVRRLIIGEAVHDSKNLPRRALAVRLQDLIEKMGAFPPTEDTLVKMISEARNQELGALDRPWSIGASREYGIQAEAISTLLQLQQLISRTLTIREAQWASRLFPVADRILKKALVGDEGRLWLFLVIIDVYVERERVALQMKEPYPDTADLDKLFFMNEDLLSETSLSAWWVEFPRRYQEAVAKVLDGYHHQALKEVEEQKGQTPTADEIEIVDQAFEVAKIGGPKALDEYVVNNESARRYNLNKLDWGTIYSEATQEVLQ